MFKIYKKNTNWDLNKLTDEELGLLPLNQLQRIRNKRWANGLKELQQRAEDELQRRDPRKNWQCLRCGKPHFHQTEIRVTSSFIESFLGWERNKYHALVCNYCGKTEIYNVLMVSSEQSLGFFGS